MHVAFVVPPYTVSSNMSGVGLRVWELAQVLSTCMPVTVVAKEVSDLQCPNVRFVSADETSWRRVVDDCSAAIFYDMPDTRIMLMAHRAGKLVISENTVPIEHLDYHAMRHGKDPDDNYQDLIARYKLQLLLSDHFLARSSVARSTLIAGLCQAGRLRYGHFELSRSLDHLISCLPVGFNRRSLAHAEAAPISLPSVEFVWSGGIWDYYDPVALIRR